jgi:hypothetical protein
MKLKCQQCGTEKEFRNHKEAYKEGWDFPPMCPVTTCGDCPSAPLVTKLLSGDVVGKGLVDVGGHIPPHTVRNQNPTTQVKKP